MPVFDSPDKVIVVPGDGAGCGCASIITLFVVVTLGLLVYECSGGDAAFRCKLGLFCEKNGVRVSCCPPHLPCRNAAPGCD